LTALPRPHRDPALITCAMPPRNLELSLRPGKVALRFDKPAVRPSPFSTCRYHSLDFRADDPCAAELGLTDALQPRSSASTAQLSRSPETQWSSLVMQRCICRRCLSPDLLRRQHQNPSDAPIPSRLLARLSANIDPRPRLWIGRGGVLMVHGGLVKSLKDSARWSSEC